ncbi:hypothetical protein K0M31_009695, partial [Melipona bicolor]
MKIHAHFHLDVGNLDPYQYVTIRGTLCNFDRNRWNHQQTTLANDEHIGVNRPPKVQLETELQQFWKSPSGNSLTT